MYQTADLIVMTTIGRRGCRWADRLAGHLCEDAKEDEEGGNAFWQKNYFGFHYDDFIAAVPQAPERAGHDVDKTGQEK